MILKDILLNKLVNLYEENYFYLHIHYIKYKNLKKKVFIYI